MACCLWVRDQHNRRGRRPRRPAIQIADFPCGYYIFLKQDVEGTIPYGFAITRVTTKSPQARLRAFVYARLCRIDAKMVLDETFGQSSIGEKKHRLVRWPHEYMSPNA